MVKSGINFGETFSANPKVAKEKLDTIMEKVLAETGLTEDEYLSMFMNVQENSYL